MSEEKGNMVKVVVKLPRAIVRFLKNLHIDTAEYFCQCIIDDFRADLNAMEGPLWDEILKAHPELKQIMEGEIE